MHFESVTGKALRRGDIRGRPKTEWWGGSDLTGQEQREGRGKIDLSSAHGPTLALLPSCRVTPCHPPVGLLRCPGLWARPANPSPAPSSGTGDGLLCHCRFHIQGDGGLGAWHMVGARLLIQVLIRPPPYEWASFNLLSDWPLALLIPTGRC